MRGPGGERQPLEHGLQLGRGVAGLTDSKLSRNHSQLHDYGDDGFEVNPRGKNTLRLHRGGADVQVIGGNVSIRGGDHIVLGNKDNDDRELWVQLILSSPRAERRSPVPEPEPAPEEPRVQLFQEPAPEPEPEPEPELEPEPEPEPKPAGSHEKIQLRAVLGQLRLGSSRS